VTPTRYALARVIQAFGVQRRSRRMSDAAFEGHLLREAEQILGERVWREVEEVEELGIEYWNLRRLVSEREKTVEQLHKAETLLAEAHEQRATLLQAKGGAGEALDAERTELLASLDALARDRDVVVTRAREIRRVYDGLRTKLEVLRSEDREEPTDAARTRERMSELREQFDALKIQRDDVAAKITDGNRRLDEVEERLEEERKKQRAEAAETFQVIGEANRRISEHKAELGLIDTRMQQLFGEIGRHVSRHAHADSLCRQAAREHRAMVDVMRALRRSINLNHRLAGV